MSKRTAACSMVCALILLSLSSTNAQRRPRWCVLAGESASVECIACSTNITVDSSIGRDCSSLNTSLDRTSCNSLVHVLDSIADGRTAQLPASTGIANCIAVFIYPTETGEPHVIPARPLRGSISRNIANQNLVLRGVSVTDGEEDVATALPSPPTTSPTASSRIPKVMFEPAVGESESATYVIQFSMAEIVALYNIDFIGTLGIIGARQLSIVAIENCSFSYFIQGAVDTFNIPNVIVRRSTFSGNGFAQVNKIDQYQGQAGGLSVAYTQTTPGLRVNITKCTFFNNSAGVITSNIVVASANETEASPSPSPPPPSRGTSSGQQRVRSGVIVDRSFPGRGGGVVLIVNSMMQAATLFVEDSVFENNTALESGGGLYVLLDGLSSHSVVVSRCRFTGNTSPSAAGGFQVTFLQEGQLGQVHDVFVVDSNFTLNEALYGGAVFFLPLTVNLQQSLEDGQLGIFARFETCLFDRNSAVEVGGAFGAAFSVLAQALNSFLPLEIRDCTFTQNTVIGVGVVSTAYYPLSFHGNNVFEFNQGPSLAVIGTRVIVHDSLVFSNNSNTGSLDGGSLFITSLGQVELTPGATITFVNNSGTLGSSLVVQSPPIPQVYSRLLYNPLCSLTHTEVRLPPDLWNVSASFISNRAVVASAVYTNNLDLCSWTQLAPPYFEPSKAFRWDFVHTSKNRPNVNTAHRNSTNQKFSVQTPAVDMMIPKEQILVYPGENIELEAVALDELGVATSAAFTLSDDSMITNNGSQDENGELYQFSPSSLNLVELGPKTPLDVSMKVRRGSSLGRRELIEAKLITDNKKHLGVNEYFSISSRPCPPGQRLPETSEFSECQCDISDDHIINCDRRQVHIEDQLWGAFTPLEPNGLYTIPCPAHYCHCIPLNTSGVLKCTFVFDHLLPDSQCHCNRTGTLCGGCVQGLGFSALLNHCVTCSDASSALIVLLIVVDAALIITLLSVSAPVPLWLYPVLFYLQLLPYFTTHFPTTFEEAWPYLVYVASALGLYFPYDFCLYEQVTALESYALRYIPLFLAVLITPVALWIKKRRQHKEPWYGLWWLVLLLFTPAVHTSLSILHCRFIPVTNLNSTRMTEESRWYVNGNVKCFSGAHIALGLAAIIVLLFSLFTVCVIFFVTFAEEKQFDRRLRWFENTYEAFKTSFNYWWWAAFELFRRLILVIMAVAFPGNSYPVILSLFVLTGITSFLKPYKNKDKAKKGYAWAVNILETFLASNVMILLLLRNTESVEEDYEEFPATEQPSSSEASQPYDRCNPVSKMTEFAIILTPFFYLPLLVSVITLVVWVGWVSITTLKAYRHRKSTDVNGDGEAGKEEGGIELPRRTYRTETVVDFRSYDPDEPDVPVVTVTPEESVPVKKNSRSIFGRLSGRRKGKGGASKKERTDMKENTSKKLKLEKETCSIRDESPTCPEPESTSYTDI